MNSGSVALVALTASLAAILAVRAILIFLPGMHAWGLNLLRFVPVPVAWGTVCLPALALVPALWRPLARVATALGRHTERGRVGAATWMLASVALVLALPDRAFLTGDLLLRQRAIEKGLSPAVLFPQALPLDVWVHHDLPRALAGFGIGATGFARAWGALEAGLIALLAVELSRALRLRGGPAIAATGATVFTGALALCTGYGKGLGEVTVAVAAVAVFGARAVTEGRSLIWIGLTLALATAFHRAGLLLMPAVATAWLLGRARGGRRAIGSLVPPAVAFAAFGPQIFTTVRKFDWAENFVFPDATQLAGVGNALVLFAPLAPLVPVLGFVIGRRAFRREVLPVWMLGATTIAFSCFMRAQQGMLRDWDLYAPAGMATAILGGILAADALREPAVLQRGERRTNVRAALALAAVLAAATWSIAWLMHLHDPESALRRVRAVIDEPPPRGAVEVARMWDFVGIRSAWLGDWEPAALAFGHSAALLPTPRVLDQWTQAELQSGHWLGALEASRQWTTRVPGSVAAWRARAAAATRVRDREISRLAALRILELAPGDPEAREILDYLQRTEPLSRGRER